MSPQIDLSWPSAASAELDDQLHRVIHAVTAAGGSVGWIGATTLEQSLSWVHPMLELTAAGQAAICVASVDGVPQGLGSWKAEQSPVFGHRAMIGKIMAHPNARGLGLGRLVTSALVEHARDAGFEMVTLGVRGNNHLAQQLYRDLGFQECGRLPNGIRVGNERFDALEMYLDLQLPEGVILHGMDPVGPGSSPAPKRI